MEIFMNWNKAIVAGLLAVTSAFSITAERVGPVSQYGQLMAGKNSSGKGQIYGSCKGVQDGAEVQVRGMSLYWSLLPDAMEFWTDAGVTTMVNDMKIQIVRAAMATGTEDWSGSWNGISLKGYTSDPNNQKQFVKTVVEAAIKNDIYVIIDWHYHNAHEQTSNAVAFFSEMAQAYGQYDNVIFEIYNEPTDISWTTIKNYANQVVAAIRQYSDNLILVGTRSWDQNPQEVIGNEVSDSEKNTAYTLHYYANSHCWDGSYSWGGNCEGTNGLTAMNAGLSVFVSEWGTGNSDGGGSPDVSRNNSWQEYLNTHKLSWANWSASKINEGTAAFTSGASATNLQYSTSGSLVKGFLASNPDSYTACSAEIDTIPDPIFAAPLKQNISFQKLSGGVQFTLPKSGVTKVEILDLLGNKRFEETSAKSAGTHFLSTKKLSKGGFLIRIRQQGVTFQTKFMNL